MIHVDNPGSNYSEQSSLIKCGRKLTKMQPITATFLIGLNLTDLKLIIHVYFL